MTTDKISIEVEIERGLQINRSKINDEIREFVFKLKAIDGIEVLKHNLIGVRFGEDEKKEI